MSIGESVIGNDLMIRLAPTDEVYAQGDTEIKNQLRLWIHNPGYGETKTFYNQIGLNCLDSLPELEGRISGLTMMAVFFPYGTKMGHLTSEAMAERIKVEGVGNEHNWFCIHDYNSTYGHMWKIFPEEDVELEPGESLQFLISELVVDSIPGMTSLYVKEKGNPQMEVIPLYKKPAPRILDLRTTPVQDAKLPYATVSWEVENASHCTLTPGDGIRYTPVGTIRLAHPGQAGDVSYTLQTFAGDQEVPMASRSFTVSWPELPITERQIFSGRFEHGYSQPDWKLHVVEKPEQPRQYCSHVSFPEAFAAGVPEILLSVTYLDVEGARNTRFRLDPENITVNGFDIVITTWWDTIVYGVGINWLAYTR